MFKMANVRPWVWGVLGIMLGGSLVLFGESIPQFGNLQFTARKSGIVYNGDGALQQQPAQHALRRSPAHALQLQGATAPGNHSGLAPGPRQLSPQLASSGSPGARGSSSPPPHPSGSSHIGLLQEAEVRQGAARSSMGLAEAPRDAVDADQLREELDAALEFEEPAAAVNTSEAASELWGPGPEPEGLGRESDDDAATRELEMLRQQLLDRIHALSEGPPSAHRLFARIDADLEPFEAKGNVTERMVDQAYCNSIEQGFRFQVIDGRLYVVGMVESFQTRLLNIQRQLWAVSQRWELPDVDMMIEQGDWPTIGSVTEVCPERGPVVAPAKHSLDPSHTHVLLAPDHTFGEWIEVMTPSWSEMRPLLAAAAADHPWEERAPTLLFRGAPTGPTRGALAASLHHWAAVHNWHIDVSIKEGIHTPEEFKSIYQHCVHKYLLHVPGNTYSGRLKYLLSCGSAVVWLGARTANLTSSYHEFWYHLLKEQEHISFLETDEHENMAAELAAAVQALVEDDGKARRMGRAAKELVESILTPDNVQQYWYRLITRYAELQGFQPRLHPDAVPIEEAMVSRRWIPRDRRICPEGCRPPPPP